MSRVSRSDSVLSCVIVSVEVTVSGVTVLVGDPVLFSVADLRQWSGGPVSDDRQISGQV